MYCSYIAKNKIFLNSCVLYNKCDQICQKGLIRSHTHSFEYHFSWPFDRYNNRLTVYAYIIAKSSTVCFYWCLIHGPVWHPWVLRWSENDSNLLSRQTASWELPQDWLVRLGIDVATFCDTYVELKTAWVETIWPYNFFRIWRFRHFVAPYYTPSSTLIGLFVVLITLWNKLSKMVGISTSYPIKGPSTEWSIDLWRKAHKLPRGFLIIIQQI